MKSKTRWFSVLLALILSSAIGLSSNSSQTGTTKKEAPLKVGMRANYPPHNWTQATDADGAVPTDGSKQYANGYDVQIAKIIDKKLRRRVVAEKTEWGGLLPALTSDKTNLTITGMSPTAEHREAINFPVSYRRSTFVVIASKTGEFAQTRGLNDFKSAKLTAQQGTSHYNLVEQLHGAKREPAIRSFSTVRQSLRPGIIDDYIAEGIEYQSYEVVDPNIAAVNSSKMQGFKVDHDNSITSIGVKKGSTELLNQVNSILNGISKKRHDQLVADAVKKRPQAGGSKRENWFMPVIRRYGSMILGGVGMVLLLTLVGAIAGFSINLPVGIVRTIPTPKSTGKKWGLKIVDWILAVYIEAFRRTPIMVQAAVIYYRVAQLWHLNLNRTVAALVIVSINTGTYLAEVIRGGINATPKDQFEAASAIGMTHSQQMWHVILPRAIRDCLPSITNESIANIRDTSISSIISISELFSVGTTVASRTFRFFQTYFIISMIYLILTFSTIRIFNFIEEKLEGPKNYNLMANQLQVEDPKEAGFEHEQ